MLSNVVRESCILKSFSDLAKADCIEIDLLKHVEFPYYQLPCGGPSGLVLNHTGCFQLGNIVPSVFSSCAVESKLLYFPNGLALPGQLTLETKWQARTN